MNPARTFVVGVDIGGTTVKAARVGAGGEVSEPVVHPSGAERSPEAVLDRTLQAIREASGGAAAGECRGIGVGIPGIVSAADGLVRYPPNFTGWTEIDVRGHLTGHTGLPVAVENDANCAALAEARFGAGRSDRNFIFVIWGTGVGGGIILGGKIYRGPGGGAGEIGHVSIDRNGPPCRCGNRGCVESYIGQKYLSARARGMISGAARPAGDRRGAEILKLSGGDPDRIEPEILSRAAEAGDPLAVELLREAGTMLGTALAGVVNVIDVTTAVVGGGISAAPAFVLEAAEEELRSRVLTPHKASVRVKRALLGNTAGMIGAASLLD